MKLKLLFSLLLINVFFFMNAATPPNATISYISPVCNGTGLIPVNFTGTTGGTFSASPADLSINPITGTVTPSSSLPGAYLITYTIPAGVDPEFSTSTTFIIVAEPNPGMDGSVTICDGYAGAIDLYSLITGEQLNGTWTRFSGAGGNFDAAAGTFTPGSGSTTSQFMYTVDTNGDCAPLSSMATIIINQMTYPNFSSIPTLCLGSTAPVLPTTSPNGVTGTWSPSVINNQQTDVYVFTPDPGQCCNVQTIIVNVGTIQPVFTFSTYNFCIGEVPVLPTTSDNGITGTWSPSTITTTEISTFTPDAGQCASTFLGTFSVSPMPNATVFVNSQTCEGFSTTITFSGTPNATVIYSIDAGANQAVTMNASGVSTMTFSFPAIGEHLICLVSVNLDCIHPLNDCFPFTVIPNIDVAPIPSVSVCDQYTLPVIPQGNYYTETHGTGTMLHAGDLITNTQAIYVYAENACSSDEEYFVVTVFHPVVIAPIPDVTACGFYNLSASNDGLYYTEPHGAGTQISPGFMYSSQTIYIYATTSTSPSCVSEDSFQVTIIPALTGVVITSENNLNYIYVDGTTVVQPLLLDATVSGNYSYQWMELHVDIPGATNPTYLLDSSIGGSWPWHYISVRITNNDTNCVTTSGLFEVGEIPVPAPIGNPIQTFNQGQTLADLVVSGSNIQWYSSALNRNSLSVPLPLNTVLVDGETYFASQTINGFESPERFGVRVQLTLANDSFHFRDLKFSPNPVVDWLTIQSKDSIKKYTVFNTLGQKVMQQNFESLDLRMQLTALKSGNYFIKLESDNKSQVIKVIKE